MEDCLIFNIIWRFLVIISLKNKTFSKIKLSRNKKIQKDKTH